VTAFAEANEGAMITRLEKAFYTNIEGDLKKAFDEWTANRIQVARMRECYRSER
jgi:hypothetical protein